MTTKDEALQMALEALEAKGDAWIVLERKAKTAIREALEDHDDTDPNAPWLTEAHLLCTDHGVEHGHITDRIRKLREALAEQPAQQQEPVAWRYTNARGVYRYCRHRPNIDMAVEYAILEPIPLYTPPPASKPWVGLTDEEKSDLWCESTGRDCVNEDTHVFADSIETKLREKNAQPSKPLTDEQYFEIGQRHWLPSIKVEKIHKEIIEAAHGITKGTK